MNSDTLKHHKSTNNKDNDVKIKNEVEFIRTNNSNNNENIDFKIIKDSNDHSDKSQCILLAKKIIPGTLYGDCEVKTNLKSSISTFEKLAIFNINRKRTDHVSPSTIFSSTSFSTQTLQQQPNKREKKHKFVKSASIARLLGNTYNTKKFEKDTNNGNTQNLLLNNNNNASNNNNPVDSLRLRCSKNTERFQKYLNMENEINETCCSEDFRDENKDFSSKAFHTISRSLGKLWWRRTHSIEISIPDPEHKVSYLGNVLTGWAKGEGCIEKPLNTLWRNYTQNHKSDVIMRIRVCASGLKATTRQHGLTEYWAHRVTYCCAPKNYPKVFCWIYRHEGRKLKHELRCHAVLCNKESVAQNICSILKENLDRALKDFKREKISRQNARLSLANSVYENPSLPRRKILLSVGGNNYRPPLERSKSAPKLMSIEEAIGEEDGETEQTNEPEMQSCCVKDSMYPAMTLGRRKCRRGHSIRRTGKNFITCTTLEPLSSENSDKSINMCNSGCKHDEKIKELSKENQQKYNMNESVEKELTNYFKINSVSSFDSDEYDLKEFLSFHNNNNNTNSSLAGELLSYFDMKMESKTTSLTSLNNNENYVLERKLSPVPKQQSAHSLDNLSSLIDEETVHKYDDDNKEDNVLNDDDSFYHQAAILDLFQKTSAIKINNVFVNNAIDENKTNKSFEEHNDMILKKQQQKYHLDSDEGSISSGCETSSIVTANIDDFSIKHNNNNNYSRCIGVNNNNLSDPQNHNNEVKQNYDINQRKTLNNVSDNVTLKISNATIDFISPKSRIISINDDTDQIPRIGTEDVSNLEYRDEFGYREFQKGNVSRNKKKKSISL